MYNTYALKFLFLKLISGVIAPTGKPIYYLDGKSYAMRNLF